MNVINKIAEDFDYVVSDIEDLPNKDYLKTAIISNLQCMNDYPKELNSRYVALVFDSFEI